MAHRIFLGLALLLVAAAPAHAQYKVKWELTAAGDPLMSHPFWQPVAKPIWWVCPPADRCLPADPATNPYEPGERARGTFFEFDMSVAGFTERSAMWLGRVAARNRPRVAGSLRAGQHVGPIGALWTGGWGDERSTLVLVACPASSRAECEYLTRADGAVAGGGSRTLSARHLGWYVYAVEYRSAAANLAPGLVAGRAPRPVASALLAVSQKSGPVKRARRAS